MAVDLHELPVFWSVFTDIICTIKPNMLFTHKKVYESENSRNWNRNRFPKLTQIDYFHLFTCLACEMTWMVLFHVVQALSLIILTEIGNNLLEAQGKDIYKLKSKLMNWSQAVYKNWLQLTHDQQFDIEIHYLFV